MRRLVRTTVAAAALAVSCTGLVVLAPAGPAAAEGYCIDLYLDITNPPTGTTVCTPGI